MEHIEWKQDFDFSYNTGMHHPWADFLDYAPFLLEESSNAPTSCFSIYTNGITKLNLSTLGEGITIIILNKNPIRDVEMAFPGGFRAWQVISLQGRTSAWWPLWSELGAEPSSSISLVFSLQASHLISFNLTFAPGEVFTRFLCHDYH